MALVLLIARLLLAAVFLVAGLAKMADLAGSRQALRDFGVPAVFASPFGTLLPLAELTVAVALIPTVSAWWAALGAVVLLLLFVVGIGFNLARGRTPDCHCFGQLHSSCWLAHSHPQPGAGCRCSCRGHLRLEHTRT